MPKRGFGDPSRSKSKEINAKFKKPHQHWRLVLRDVIGRYIVWKGGASAPPHTRANLAALEAAEKRSNAVILSPFAVILSAAKNLALPAQGKLREGSRSEC